MWFSKAFPICPVCLSPSLVTEYAILPHKSLPDIDSRLLPRILPQTFRHLLFPHNFQNYLNAPLAWTKPFYYIKVSGIPSGNKLIKTIWYPHMWRYHIWQHFSFVPSTALKFVSVWSKHPRILFGNRRQSSVIFGKSSEMFGKCPETFVWPSEQFWKIFGNLRKVIGNLRKIVKNGTLI